jgi:hypothetical protein
MNAKVLSVVTLILVIGMIALYLFVPQKIQPSGKIAVLNEKPADEAETEKAL